MTKLQGLSDVEAIFADLKTGKMRKYGCIADVPFLLSRASCSRMASPSRYLTNAINVVLIGLLNG